MRVNSEDSGIDICESNEHRQSMSIITKSIISAINVKSY